MILHAEVGIREYPIPTKISYEFFIICIFLHVSNTIEEDKYKPFGQYFKTILKTVFPWRPYILRHTTSGTVQHKKRKLNIRTKRSNIPIVLNSSTDLGLTRLIRQNARSKRHRGIDMKKVSRHRRMLVLAISLTMALNIGISLATSPVSAAKHNGTRKWLEWEGTQMPGPMLLSKITITERFIEIYGEIWMITTDAYDGGYAFVVDGEVVPVAYEIIHYMKIHVPKEILSQIRSLLSQGFELNEIFNDPNMVLMFYSLPRSGWFTWHTQDGSVVAKGTFRSNGRMGRLQVRGSRLLVKGTFGLNPMSDWVQVGDVWVPTLWHAGWYTAK